MTKIIMNGYLGQMGAVITKMAERRSDISIVAGVDVAKPQTPAPFPTFGHIDECDMPADVIIDFSTANAVEPIIDYAVQKRIPAVICTTGLSEYTLNKIKEASKTVAMFKSANMSLGINLIADIIRRVSMSLYDEGFDIEITERHHNKKTDSPSGTALLLADAVNESAGGNLRYVYDRTTRSERRERNELGITSVRGGTIVGRHSVIYAGRDECIEITHEAFSKEVFAVGALKAARFINGKQAGLYDMRDVMEE